jgi:predicted branched-subunit amino acid permease
MVVAPLLDFYTKLIPFLLLAVVLILCDLRFGVARARRSGEAVRLSRAVRRTLNKLVDYICWVTLAGLFGNTFGEVFGIPLLSVILLLIIYGIEMNSCYNNYFEARGIKKKINIFKFFKNKTEIIEPEEESGIEN